MADRQFDFASCMPSTLTDPRWIRFCHIFRRDRCAVVVPSPTVIGHRIVFDMRIRGIDRQPLAIELFAGAGTAIGLLTV